jgi:hypothetical protein
LWLEAVERNSVEKSITVHQLFAMVSEMIKNFLDSTRFRLNVVGPSAKTGLPESTGLLTHYVPGLESAGCP